MVPIDQKGDKGNTSNYKLISLIDIITKLYVNYLLYKRHSFVQKTQKNLGTENGLLPEEQTGFRSESSTMDNFYFRSSKRKNI